MATISTAGGFLMPESGASLLLSFSFRQHQSIPSSQNAASSSSPFLILGSGHLAAQRAFAALEADASVVILGQGTSENACEEIQWRIANGQIGWVNLNEYKTRENVPGCDDAFALEHYLSTLFPSTPPKFLCITDTLLSSVTRRSRVSATFIYSICRARNINVNTTDYPDLCDFSFTTTYRFPGASDPSSSTSSSGGALQIGITTNGQGCRLAGRIKREIVARLPRDVGKAVGNVGRMRVLAKGRDENHAEDSLEGMDPCAETDTPSTPNSPVPQRTKKQALDSESENSLERTRRRMKWVAQISLTEADMKRYLEDEYAPNPSSLDPTIQESSSFHSSPPLLPPTTIHSLFPSPPKSNKPGQILLIGSGPGHPSLLTLAAHRALTELADIVLADKLVPAAVLALIPSRVEVVIARKFPGNADRAQQEMMERAVLEARKGKCVVRLKQGDPAIYGRFGEEVLYFRHPPSSDTSDTHPPLPPTLVIPGVSSALAAPTLFDMPCTQRGAATSFLITTPVGKGGKALEMPKYERARTVVVLMGVARLGSVVKALLGPGGYPPHLPIAIIERASMPDQRVVESTLEDVERGMDSAEVGAQRPPGMMVIGWSVPALWGEGNVDVLASGDDGDGDAAGNQVGQVKSEATGLVVKADDKCVEVAEKVIDEKQQEARDVQRVRRWLGDGVRWRVREGLVPAWDMFDM
ncbi:tetrapyrrole methylase [Rhodocollybia butyracea]|uniref:precorrin-2 dehydrogenase n=1 Tax=Rhodocollybia butyracea TaxID=206335 RepID=A0A9P5UB08_9AGAR|nr:tetrapyrrole methylase [Rhodocollybia butyracea]